jgi:hypothetical protein
VDEDIVAIIAGTSLVAIPLLAISARIALKPITQAIVHLRGGLSGEVTSFHGRRIQALEAEVESLKDEVGRLREVEQFHARLTEGRPQAAIPPRAD